MPRTKPTKNGTPFPDEVFVQQHIENEGETAEEGWLVIDRDHESVLGQDTGHGPEPGQMVAVYKLDRLVKITSTTRTQEKSLR